MTVVKKLLFGVAILLSQLFALLLLIVFQDICVAQ